MLESDCFPPYKGQKKFFFEKVNLRQVEISFKQQHSRLNFRQTTHSPTQQCRFWLDLNHSSGYQNRASTGNKQISKWENIGTSYRIATKSLLENQAVPRTVGIHQGHPKQTAIQTSKLARIAIFQKTLFKRHRGCSKVMANRQAKYQQANSWQTSSNDRPRVQEMEQEQKHQQAQEQEQEQEPVATTEQKQEPEATRVTGTGTGAGRGHKHNKNHQATSPKTTRNHKNMHKNIQWWSNFRQQQWPSKAKHAATYSSGTVFGIKMYQKKWNQEKIAFRWQGLLYNMVFLQKVSNSSSRKMLESYCFPP